MTLVSDLQAELALRIRDTDNAEVSTAQLLSFINMAVKDARNAGWLLYLEEDESLVEASGTYSFTVPANFAYLSQIRRQDTSLLTYPEIVLDDAWRLGLDSGVPTLIFNSDRYSADPGARLKLIGQKRPTIYSSSTDTVDTELDAFLRERSAMYVFQFVAGGRSELAGWRQQQALIARAESKDMLSYSPQQFRMKPNSRYVPGR